MISIIIVVSWHGHHRSYCTQFVRACDSFSDSIFLICPADATPLEDLAEFPDIAAKTHVLNFANRYPSSGFRRFKFLVEDLRELQELISQILQIRPGDKYFIFHSDLNSLFWNIFHLPMLAIRIRRLFAWKFSGYLVTPDRRWTLAGIRGSVEQLMNSTELHGWLIKRLNIAVNPIINHIGDTIRKYYLWQRNLAIRFSHCMQIALQDERYLLDLSLRTKKKTVFLPEVTSLDVSDSPPEIVKELQRRKQNLTVIGLLGALGPRKGVNLLVEVIRDCNTEGFLFIIAGPCGIGDITPEQWRFLYSQGNVIFKPEVIASEQDFNSILRACDIVYCAYLNHIHSSNLLSKAVAFRRPLLVSDGELMAKRVNDYGLGSVLQKQTPVACMELLHSMSAIEYQNNYLKEGRFQEYAKDHSFESLKVVMSELSQSKSISHVHKQ